MEAPDVTLDPRWWDPAAIAAATVVVLRQSASAPEVLMLRRDTDLSFAGGMWVFPGGRIDPEDHPGGLRPSGVADLEPAARRAAVREADEEAGLTLDAASLVRWSHWTPPPEAPKRFSTAFYLAIAEPDAEVVIDDSEIRAHEWMRPGEALERHATREIKLGPPTFITLWQLSLVESAADALERAARPGFVEHFSTRITGLDGELVALYHGDAGYKAADPTLPGPRHRLSMSDGPWRYERSS